MTIVDGFILGVVQGLTEFLPVSSSGHLVLAEIFLGLDLSPADMQGLNILLHAATLLALLVCYRRQWLQLLLSPFRPDPSHHRVLLLLLIATVPAGIVGVFFADAIAHTFHGITPVALALLGTAAVLLIGHYAPAPAKQTLNVWSALLVGIVQAFALVPGASRSGLTITGAQYLGLSRQAALDFSFLMAVPVFAGALVLALTDVWQGSITLPSTTVTLTSVTTSFVSSVLAIMWLRQFVVQRSLVWFVPYLVLVGVALLFV